MKASSAILALAAAATMALAAVPAKAQDGCWDDRTLAAARLHEFHIRLTVTSLRCRGSNAGLEQRLATYYERYGSEVDDAEAYLRYAVERLYVGQKRAFTNYSAAVGNRYGAGRNSADFCGLIGEMLTALSDPASTTDDLHTYALLLVRRPAIEDHCPAGENNLARGGD